MRVPESSATIVCKTTTSQSRKFTQIATGLPSATGVARPRINCFKDKWQQQLRPFLAYSLSFLHPWFQTIHAYIIHLSQISVPTHFSKYFLDNTHWFTTRHHPLSYLCDKWPCSLGQLLRLCLPQGRLHHLHFSHFSQKVYQDAL
jgi:hypothetical protein